MKWETFIAEHDGGIAPSRANEDVGGSWVMTVPDEAEARGLWRALRTACAQGSLGSKVIRGDEVTSRGFVMMVVVPGRDKTVLQDQGPVRTALDELRALGMRSTVFFKSKETGTNVYYSPAGTGRVYKTTKHPIARKLKKNKAGASRTVVMAAPPPSKVLGKRIRGPFSAQAAPPKEEDDEELLCLQAGQTTNFQTPPAHRGLNPAGVCANLEEEDEPDECKPRRFEKLITVGDRLVTVGEAVVLNDSPLSIQEFYDRFVRKTPDRCEEEERSPQRSDEWKQARKYAVTTSQFGAAAGVSPYSTPMDVVRSKLWETFSGNTATKWGTFCESKAEEAYRRWCKDDLRIMYRSFGKRAADAVADSLVLEERGLIKYPENPWMGASPDGIAIWTEPDGTKRRRLVEYKCPYFLWRDTGMHPYAKFKSKDKDSLPLPPQYRAQIQGVMGMFLDEDERIKGTREGTRSNRREAWDIVQCDFVVWQPRRCWVSRVDIDVRGWRSNLYPALRTWFSNVYLPAAVHQYNGKLDDGCAGPRRRALRLDV